MAAALGAGLFGRVNVRGISLADGGDGSIDVITSAGFDVVELDLAITSSTSRPAQIARKGEVFH